MYKAQTNMILIILVIVVFGGLVLFLLSFARTVSQDEYMNLYAHNLLVSVLRTDTGYTDIDCKLTSDVIRCGFFSSDYRCGEQGPNCYIARSFPVFPEHSSGFPRSIPTGSPSGSLTVAATTIHLPTEN